MDAGRSLPYIAVTMPLLILLSALMTALTGAITGVRVPDAPVERVRLAAVAQVVVQAIPARALENPALVFATVVAAPTAYRASAPAYQVSRYSDRRRE